MVLHNSGCQHFQLRNLTPQELRDALAIRYRKPLLNVPAFCDGCGAPSTLDHFFNLYEGWIDCAAA